MDEHLTQFNHLTRAGLQYLLKGEPKPVQTVLGPLGVGTSFNNKLNFMFFHVRPADNSRTVAEENIFDIEFPDINDPNVRYTHIGTGSLTPLYSFTGTDDIIIDGIGIGYHDIAGNGENDFIFSYAHIDSVNGIIRRDNDDERFGWQVACQYYLNEGNTGVLPNVKVNINNKDYEFRPSSYTSVGYFQNRRTQSGGLFYDGAASAWGVDNTVNGLTTFAWTVAGKPIVPASSFEELLVQNEKSRKVSRVFRVKYKNNRPFPIHITGFKLAIGALPFTYRSLVDNYIEVGAGKTLTLDLAAEMFVGALPPSNTTQFSSKNMAIPDVDHNYLSLQYDMVSNIIGTTYEGTAKEKVTTIVNRDGYTSSLRGLGTTDTLTKYVLQYKDGSRSGPLYMLSESNPSSYAFAKPQITSADGWTVNNDDVVFRITAPSDVGYIEFASIDGIWSRFPVTPNAINFIKLPCKFLYEQFMYIRWASLTTTGLILVHVDKQLTGNICLPIEYVYGNTTNPTIIGYSSKTTGNLPVGVTSSATYVEGTTTLTAITGGVNGDYYAHDAPLDLSSGLWGKTFIGPMPNSKWFDSINMKLVSVAKFDDVVAVTRHDITKPDSLIKSKYKITPVKTSEVVGHPSDSHPKIKDITLVKNPNIDKPNNITGYLSSQATSIELFNSVTNEVLSTFTSKEGMRYTLNTTEKMYTHIAYGLRYLDSLGQNLSAGKEYYFYGVELAPPEAPEEVYYDADLQLLTFVTPPRATRATIKRWGIELYSFECVVGGTTSLYSSEVFNTAGNYVLTLYNSEGTPSDITYIFGYNESDQAIKPNTTGPYSFNDWSYSNSNYTTGSDMPFMNPIWFEQGFYNIEINGQAARVVNVIRNKNNIIMEVFFEVNGTIISWSTGYYSESPDYTTAPSYTSVTLVKGSGSTDIVVWHEWELYSEVGIDKFGKISSSKYTPVYGKNTSYYQFSEISNGYIKNSLKLLITSASYPTNRIPYEYDSTFIAKAPTAKMYIHSYDIVGSINFKTDPSQRAFRYSTYGAFINGKSATWEDTRNDDDAVIKLRCYTDEAAFIYDTAKPNDGWVLEGYDAALVGHPDYVDLVYTLGFFWGYKYSYSSYLGTSLNSTGMDGNYNHMRYNNDYYREQLTARIAPYMSLLSYEEDTGNSLLNQSYIYPYEPSYRDTARWSEIYMETNPVDMFTNSSVIINGQLATVTSAEITIPYKPLAQGLISSNQFEKPTDSQSYNKTYTDITPYTYTAYTLSTDSVEISNTDHPYVYKIKRHGYINIDDGTNITMIIVRNKILQESINLGDWYSKTNNVTSGNYLTSLSGYNYPYVVGAFYLNYPKIMKYLDSPKSQDVDDVNVRIPSVSSLYLLKILINNLTRNDFYTEEENVKYEGLIQINEEDFTLSINQAFLDYVLAVRDVSWYGFTDHVFELSNVDNSKSIKVYDDSTSVYNGFPLGTDIHLKVTLFNSDSEANTLFINALADTYYSENSSPNNELLGEGNLYLLGYNIANLWNYIPHQLPSGRVGDEIRLSTFIPSEGDYVDGFIPEDRTELVLPLTRNQSRQHKVLYLSYIYVAQHLNGELELTTLLDNLSAECNGISADSIDIESIDGTTRIIFSFESLKLKVTLDDMENGLVFLDSDTLADKDVETQYIFKLVTKGLSITSNESILEIYNDQNNDKPATILTYGNVIVFEDYNGTERYQSLYIAYGNKPREIIPIDPRIGNSPFPEYGQYSVTYTELSSNNAE